jgi:hypothetical protein
VVSAIHPVTNFEQVLLSLEVSFSEFHFFNALGYLCRFWGQLILWFLHQSPSIYIHLLRACLDPLALKISSYVLMDPNRPANDLIIISWRVANY